MLDNTIGNDRTMRPENEGQAKGATQSNEMSLGDARTLHPGEDGNLGRLDRYLLLRKLGGGGFGSVYLARDTVADIEVAVKGLPPLIKINPEELERVRNNFRLVQKLSHQNIAGLRVLHQAESVEYYDYDTEQGLRVDRGDYLVVMEYVPGVTLSQWRRQFSEGRVPVAHALDICRRVADALDYAHSQEIVHRDIKPSNNMVITHQSPDDERGTANDERQTVKVLDFGLAAEIRSSSSSLSASSRKIGRRAFPRQIT